MIDRRTSLLVLGSLCLAAFGLTAWLWLGAGAGRPTIASGTNPTTPAAKPPVRPAATPSAQSLEALAARMQNGASPAARQAALAAWREWLRDTPAAARQAQLSAFFATRQDADLGGQFQVAAGGALSASPTLRVWLLDELAKVDPAAAAALAREVLGRPDSADEWAIALRSLARANGGPEDLALLKERTLTLLGHAAWQQDPSAGFLHAFDVAVHLRDRDFAPVLGGLLRQTNQAAVAHAAFLALDRLVMAAPAACLQELQANPAWLAGREGTRAGIFARADATDSAQRPVLEAYLLDARRSAEELGAFAAAFPNANLFLSHNLLTTQSPPDGATLLRRDMATLAVVRQWLADARFAPVQGPLRTIEARLQTYVRPAPKQ